MSTCTYGIKTQKQLDDECVKNRELEQSKNCAGCIHELEDVSHFPCIACSMMYTNYYTQKDK